MLVELQIILENDNTGNLAYVNSMINLNEIEMFFPGLDKHTDQVINETRIFFKSGGECCVNMSYIKFKEVYKMNSKRFVLN